MPSTSTHLTRGVPISSDPLRHAARWFLQSGIQTTHGDLAGGVARFYLAAEQRNKPVSNEITGYAVSALMYLSQRAEDPAERTACLEAGLQAARFLTRTAWDAASSTFPFEPASPLVYFFDTGIIARGLMAAWRATGDAEFRERAQEAALSLLWDFMGEAGFHTVIELPEKQPLPEEPRWSRRPGCFQLKAALIWLEMEDPRARQMFDLALAFGLATHDKFFDLAPGEARTVIMDRLHAYSYFLEGLLSAMEHEEARAALRSGLARAAALYREIRPEFERSDVAAQLLRVRLIAHHLDAAAFPLDEAAAADEAARAAGYQELRSDDGRLRGGFWFGSKRGEILPYSNPVSTAFCLQALDLWRQHQAGRWTFALRDLI